MARYNYFLIPSFSFYFFLMIRIADNFCATSYYFLNISYFAVMLRNREWKDVFKLNNNWQFI